jgi:predicted nucleotidyltransferase
MEDQNQELTELVDRIVDAVNPEKIILFGSAARGDMTAQSDYDFLIVMPDGIHKRQTAQYLYKVLAETGSSVDILVTEKSDLEKYKTNIGLIYKTALEEGKILYAA